MRAEVAALEIASRSFPRVASACRRTYSGLLSLHRFGMGGGWGWRLVVKGKCRSFGSSFRLAQDDCGGRDAGCGGWIPKTLVRAFVVSRVPKCEGPGAPSFGGWT